MKILRPIVRSIAIAIALFCGFYPAHADDLNPDARYLEVLKEYIFHRDGSNTFHYRHRVLIGSHYAFHSLYGEDFIVYNPAFQEVKILVSRTIKANGQSVDSPANAFNEVLPGFAQNVAIASGMREMVVTHTALEVGAIIEFEYTLTTHGGYIPALAMRETPFMNAPADKVTLRLKVPCGSHLQYVTANTLVKPHIQNAPGRKTIEWDFVNMPARSADGFQPADFPDQPWVLCTMYRRHEDAMQLFASNLEYNFLLPANAVAQANQRFSPIPGPDLKALAIQEWVVNDFNLFAVPLAMTAYRVRPLTEVWRNNGGTAAEKACLMAAIMQQMGIQAIPVAYLGPLAAKVSGLHPQNIEKWLVKAPIPGKEDMWLPVDKLDQGFSAFKGPLIAFDKGSYSLEAAPPIMPARMSLTGRLSLNDSLRLTGNLNLEVAGMSYPAWFLLRDTNNLAKWVGEQLGSKNPGHCQFVKQDSESATIDVAYKKSMTDSVADMLLFTLPAISGAMADWKLDHLATQRETDFEFPFAISESNDYSISLPQGLVPAALPIPLEIQNPWGHVQVALNYENGYVHVVRNLEIRQTRISVADYPALREMANAWALEKYNSLLLTREKP